MDIFVTRHEAVEDSTTVRHVLNDETDVGGEHFNDNGFNWTLHELFEQEFDKSTFEIVLKCVSYAVAIGLAFFGNLAIMIVILRNKSLRTKFNIYIVNLAVADFLMPSMSMWLHLTSSLEDEWMLGSGLCKIHTFIQVTVVCASVFTLSVLTIDRYLSTIQSRLTWVTQSFQIGTIVVIWAAAIGTATPWLVFTVYEEFDWFGDHEIVCQANFPSVLGRKVYYSIFFALCFVIPLVVMFGLVISSVIKDNQRTTDASSQYPLHIDMRKRAIYLLLTILVVFAVCWTPQQSLLIWDVFRDRTKKPRGIEELQYIALYMAYSTSAINPIIYFIHNKYFRDAFYHICQFKCRGLETSISPQDTDTFSQSGGISAMETTDTTAEPSDPGPSHVSIPMATMSRPVEDDALSVDSSID